MLSSARPADRAATERRRLVAVLGCGLTVALLAIWITSPENALMATYVGVSVFASVVLNPARAHRPAWEEWAGFAAIIAPLALSRGWVSRLRRV